MMRPIASACAATCCSKVAGSPLTRRVTMTDMAPPWVGFDDHSPPKDLTLAPRHRECCLSEPGPRSSRGRVVVGWCGCDRSAGARAYLGARRWAGDVMVDGSIRGERLRLLGLWWTA